MLEKLLIKHEILDKECSDLILSVAKSKNSFDIARAIIDKGLLDEETLVTKLCNIDNCERLPADQHLIMPETLPEDYGVDPFVFTQLRVVPIEIIGEESNCIKVAVVNPYDRSVLRQIEFFSNGKKVQPIVATCSQIKEAIGEDIRPELINKQKTNNIEQDEITNNVHATDQLTDLKENEPSELSVNETVPEQKIELPPPTYNVAKLNKELMSVLLSNSTKEMFELAMNALSRDIPKGMIVWFDESKVCFHAYWNMYKNTYDVFAEGASRSFDAKLYSCLKKFMSNQWYKFSAPVQQLDNGINDKLLKFCFKSVFYHKNLACIIFSNDNIMNQTGYLNTVSELLQSLVRRVK